MDQMKRFAIYFAPRDGAFADAAAHWLGWDARTGESVAQPDVPGMADLTAAPRRYGFHGTIKPPFRLADGTTPVALGEAVATLAASLRTVSVEALAMVRLEGFLALIPQGDTAALADLAARVVLGLEASSRNSDAPAAGVADRLRLSLCDGRVSVPFDLVGSAHWSAGPGL